MSYGRIFDISCWVYSRSDHPELGSPEDASMNIVQTLCEHDPLNGPQDLGDTDATDQQISDLGEQLPGS